MNTKHSEKASIVDLLNGDENRSINYKKKLPIKIGLIAVYTWHLLLSAK